MVSKRLNIQWAAGLYAGEGAIYLQSQHGGRYRYPKLTIGNTERDLLDEFRRIVGVGRINGPYVAIHRDGAERKDMYYYNAYNKDAIKVATRLRPYLNGRRKAKIDEVLGAKHGRQ